MPRNRVQHQKGLSDDAFERLYPDEQACRKAWFAWRWPEGFKCPRCAGSTYCEIRGRQLLQCRQCRHQTSLIAGTVLQGTKLPMRVWFRAMHLLAQGKKGLSNIELGRRLGISTNAAWRVQPKLMQAMIERDRRYKLGAGGPRIEIDDAYIGGERTVEGSGRGRRGHTPFIIAVETTADRRPLYARLQVVRGFQTAETKRLCARVEAGTTLVSDGGQWFQCIAWQPGLIHERHITGSGRASARHPAFRWANTLLANTPCCMDRRGGRTEPDPCSGLCDADVLRASQLQHSVQHVGRDGHLARLSPVRLRPQPIADDTLPARDIGLHQSAPAVSRRPLPAHAAALGNALQMPVALRRCALCGVARYRIRARRHDHGRSG